jgi:hypothetical protein
VSSQTSQSSWDRDDGVLVLVGLIIVMMGVLSFVMFVFVVNGFMSDATVFAVSEKAGLDVNGFHRTRVVLLLDGWTQSSQKNDLNNPRVPVTLVLNSTTENCGRIICNRISQ